MRVLLKGEFPVATALTYAEACRALHAAEAGPLSAEFYFALRGSPGTNPRSWALVAVYRELADRVQTNLEAYVLDLPLG